MYMLNEVVVKSFSDYLRGCDLKDPVKRIHGETLEDKLFFILNFVSICHSINYDFLADALGKVIKASPDKFTASYLSKISDEELYDWLKEYPKKWRLKIEQRAEIIRDLNQKLLENYSGSALKLFEETKYNIPLIYDKLDLFKAFNEDPLRKKTSCVIGEINQNNLVNLTDWEYLRPQIDYHIARVVLRNGLIKLSRDEIDMLTSFRSANESEATNIRAKCIDALMRLSKESGQSVDDIRVMYWYVGRECCNPDNPCCDKCSHEKTTYSKNGGCFLNSVCQANKEKSLKSIKEPNFETTFY